VVPSDLLGHTTRVVVFRASSIEDLTGLLGLAEGMRTAAQMIGAADEIILDVDDETVEFVATTLGKPIRR
jgi:hypothetical protein